MGNDPDIQKLNEKISAKVGRLGQICERLASCHRSPMLSIYEIENPGACTYEISLMIQKDKAEKIRQQDELLELLLERHGRERGIKFYKFS